MEQVDCFVNTMEKESIILITENDLAHIGIIEDYEYLPEYDNEQDAMCHRRSVEWVSTVKKSDLIIPIQNFLSNRDAAVSQYPEPYDVHECRKNYHGIIRPPSTCGPMIR